MQTWVNIVSADTYCIRLFLLPRKLCLRGMRTAGGAVWGVSGDPVGGGHVSVEAGVPAGNGGALHTPAADGFSFSTADSSSATKFPQLE